MIRGIWITGDFYTIRAELDNVSHLEPKPTKPSSPFDFRIPRETSRHRRNRSGLPFTLSTNSHPPTLAQGSTGKEQATRKPMLLFLLSRELLFRYADRQFLGLLFQSPPLLLAYPTIIIE
ncbi:hypothetical protein [[Leptolyngbya] sp. PCC 7376]|uniref:hypothetical protein n=1 Tax=[Leptolyngbya] sp. PCC 7376 TaxID=111781 RepID=UPI00135A2BF4|nr:hypothetical protein [[Leptolyngbya] sp. PCC 7376]